MNTVVQLVAATGAYFPSEDQLTLSGFPLIKRSASDTGDAVYSTCSNFVDMPASLMNAYQDTVALSIRYIPFPIHIYSAGEAIVRSFNEPFTIWTQRRGGSHILASIWLPPKSVLARHMEARLAQGVTSQPTEIDLYGYGVLNACTPRMLTFETEIPAAEEAISGTTLSGMVVFKVSGTGASYVAKLLDGRPPSYFLSNSPSGSCVAHVDGDHIVGFPTEGYWWLHMPPRQQRWLSYVHLSAVCDFIRRASLKGWQAIVYLTTYPDLAYTLSRVTRPLNLLPYLPRLPISGKVTDRFTFALTYSLCSSINRWYSVTKIYDDAIYFHFTRMLPIIILADALKLRLVIRYDTVPTRTGPMRVIRSASIRVGDRSYAVLVSGHVISAIVSYAHLRYRIGKTKYCPDYNGGLAYFLANQHKPTASYESAPSDKAWHTWFETACGVLGAFVALSILSVTRPELQRTANYRRAFLYARAFWRRITPNSRTGLR